MGTRPRASWGDGYQSVITPISFAGRTKRTNHSTHGKRPRNRVYHELEAQRASEGARNVHGFGRSDNEARYFVEFLGTR